MPNFHPIFIYHLILLGKNATFTLHLFFFCHINSIKITGLNFNSIKRVFFANYISFYWRSRSKRNAVRSRDDMKKFALLAAMSAATLCENTENSLYTALNTKKKKHHVFYLICQIIFLLKLRRDSLNKACFVHVIAQSNVWYAINRRIEPSKDRRCFMHFYGIQHIIGDYHTCYEN